jgi:glycosyltransferase involved in cell wall biosynthesis
MNSKKKNILLLAPQPFFVERGTPINVREILNSLSSDGYQVTLLSYPYGKDLEIENVKFEKSPKIPFLKTVKVGPSLAKIFLDFLFFFKALHLSLKTKYDLFHGIEEAAFIAQFLSAIHRKPFIADVDSSMSDQLRESGFIKNSLILNFFEYFEKICFRKASCVLTVCEALSQKVLKLEQNAKIMQIEDFPFLTEDLQVEALDLRKKYQIDCNKKLLIYAGNFEAYQGIELLLQAYSILKNKLRKLSLPENFQLVLVGGKLEDIDRLRSLSKSLEINDSVTFTGALPTEYMYQVHEQSDVLLSPRLTGINTPLKIYNYLDSERIIVATNIISHTQILNNSNALLAEPNAQDLAYKLELSISEDPRAVELRNNLVRTAKELVDHKYSRARFNLAIKELYAKILNYD